MVLQQKYLHDGWRLRSSDEHVPSDLKEELQAQGIHATVPGTVYSDLHAAQLIQDPLVGMNESTLKWVDLSDWEYFIDFDWTANEDFRHDLVAQGLDTFATVRLNGLIVGNARNQHRTHRWDISAMLRPGPNHLSVSFASPIRSARQEEAIVGDKPHLFEHPYNAVRKAAYSYGWDWGPSLAGAGIWKPIRIESWTGVRLTSVRPVAKIDDSSRHLDVYVEVERHRYNGPAAIEAQVVGRSVSISVEAEKSTGSIHFRELDVELWWPRDMGDQNLYELLVTSGESTWRESVGFRHIEIARGTGAEFTIHVNGQPTWARGFNWIPASIATLATRAETVSRLNDALAAGANIIRVWGGGFYESEELYSWCDQNGMLVWQDFLFACAAYSEHERIYQEVELEAREAIVRLGSHPALCIWNGCNENLWFRENGEWSELGDEQTWGEGYYHALLPALVAELAPHVAYIDGSPTSFDSGLFPNDSAYGLSHLWEAWNEKPYSDYATHKPRFVSEFGWAAPASRSVMQAAAGESEWSPSSEGVLAHIKATDGAHKLNRGLGWHGGEWQTAEEWRWLSQLVQARALRFAINHFRSQFPLNGGCLIWQLNDCWPAISWSVVDFAGVRKPAWYAVKQVFQSRYLALSVEDGKWVAHNDSGLPWSEPVKISSVDMGGRVLKEVCFELSVPSKDATMHDLTPIIAGDNPTRELLIATRSDGSRQFFPLVDWKDVELPPADMTIDAWQSEHGYTVAITALSTIVDLLFQLDVLDQAATISDGLINLLPGDKVVVEVTTKARIADDMWLEIAHTANEVASTSTTQLAVNRPGVDG